MAMNQEEKAESTSSTEKPQMNELSGFHTSYTSPGTVPWNSLGEDKNTSVENGDLSSSANNQDKQVQDTINQTPATSTSSSGVASVAQGYSGYAAYSNSDPYGYSSADYAAYYGQYQQQAHYQQQPTQYQDQPVQYQQPAQYQQQPSSYQQQTNQSYPQQTVGYQNTGASHQPLSSFQNTGSYGEPANYTSTYYNPGDYQTSGSYTTGPYSTQTNFWHGAPATNYGVNQYPNYASDSNSAYGSTTVVTAPQYRQHYSQWSGYYSQNSTEVTCAPGTENITVSVSSTPSSIVSSGNTGFTDSKNPTAIYTSSWRPASSLPVETNVQLVSVNGSISEGNWKYSAPNFQNDPLKLVSPLVQNASEITTQYENSKPQHSISAGHGSTALDAAYYQGTQSHHQNLLSASHPTVQLDAFKASKLQIPTNPRIASNIPATSSRIDKDSIAGTMSKPAYIGVKIDKQAEKTLMQEEDNSILKPGVFPKSLRGYVERALARCKNDRQMAACQALMKEVITKATADGTLHTKDWDVEPLFPLPNDDMVNEANTKFSVPSFLTPKIKSPRRVKSRWEPIQDEKAIGKPENTYTTAKYGFLNNKQFSSGGLVNKNNVATKSSFTDQKSFIKNFTRSTKRQRIGHDPNADGDGDTSSDSDQEKSLTKYYATAVALADTPEEKKRRENRSKRFEKVHSNQNHVKANHAAAEFSHVRRVGTLHLSTSVEESGSRAVEDIDWDALVIKGTCQEIEKRYLRLTSAPDPATVRPEDVLEKALMMVQNSQKNYLYKCDQLKSIRQDLTVQHIRNEFTVKVYETHARLAIEAGDLPEFNQCQSQLKTLYAEKIIGSHMEFAAYHLLSVISHSSNNRDLLSAMSRLSDSAKEDKAVKHALSVRRAVSSGNYVMFFRLYNSAPNLNALFMDLYVEKMRYGAVKSMSRSYRPTIPVPYISQILGFSNGSEDCIEWLKAHGASLVSESSGEFLLDTKVSALSLCMPEPEDGVSHGDANLAVNDFLARCSS